MPTDYLIAFASHGRGGTRRPCLDTPRKTRRRTMRKRPFQILLLQSTVCGCDGQTRPQSPLSKEDSTMPRRDRTKEQIEDFFELRREWEVRKAGGGYGFCREEDGRPVARLKPHPNGDMKFSIGAGGEDGRRFQGKRGSCCRSIGPWRSLLRILGDAGDSWSFPVIPGQKTLDDGRRKSLKRIGVCKPVPSTDDRSRPASSRQPEPDRT